MPSTMVRLTAALTMTGLLVGACGSAPKPQPAAASKQTPTQDKSAQPRSDSELGLRDKAGKLKGERSEGDAARTIAEGAGVGCIVGAIIGGALFGRAGAAVGCAAGLVAGGGVGYGVAQSKADYIAQEEDLDKLIVEAKRQNEVLSSLLADLEQVIAKDQAELSKLEKDYNAGQLQLSEVHAELVEVNSNRVIVRQSADGLRQVAAALRVRVKESEKDGAAKDLKLLEEQAVQLENATNRLAELEVTMNRFVDTIQLETPGAS